MTVRIVGKASELIESLSFLGASPDSSKAGFNPLLLEVTDGRASVSTPNTARTGFVYGYFECQHEGEGQMVIPIIHVLGRLRKFFSSEEVVLDYDIEKGKLQIITEKRRSTTYPPAVGDCNAMPLPFPKTKKGMIQFGPEGQRKVPTTQVKIDASELQVLLDMASEVEVDFFRFHFKTKGKSECWIGDESDKTQSPMHEFLECKVKGKEAKVEYSADFPEIVASLKGPLVMYMSTNTPVWIKQKWKKGYAEYVIAPRIDEG